MENVNEINSIEEVFEIMDGWKGKRQEYTEIVTEFLKTKARQAYHTVNYEEDVEDGLEFELLKPLSEDNVSEIKAFIDAYINKAYAEEIAQGEEIDDVWRNEVISEAIGELSDKEYLREESRFFRPTVVTDIDLNTKYYCYRIKIATFPDGMDNPPKILNWLLNLPDDKYIYLTAEYMVNPNFSFNKLRTKDKELYNIICNDIEGRLHRNTYPCDVPTYTVEFTEIVEDAQLLLKSIENSVEY